MNLTLLRVCSALFIVSGLNTLAGLLLRLLTTGMENENLLMGYVVSILMGVLGIVAGAIALAKKTPLPLMIIGAIAIAGRLYGAAAIPVTYMSAGLGFKPIFNAMVNNFVSTSLVLCIATFLIKRSKSGNPNLGLLRFCAVIFLVDGAHDFIKMTLSLLTGGSVPPVAFALAVVAIAVGIFALAKRNVPVLKIYALVAIALVLWNTLMFAREQAFSGHLVGEVIIGLIFNTFIAVCIATFFLDVEKTKLYIQKVKGLFFKWKSLT